MLEQPYPPAGHFLRHLRIETDTTDPGRSIGHIPALPDLSAADGTLHIGAIAAALDVTAGALAIASVHPDWTATTHLSIQTSAGALAGSAVSLACQVLRAGRTSVFAGADLTASDGTAIGSATIGFARLTRRDGNPTGAPEGGVHRLGDGEADGPRPPLIEFLGLRDAPGGGVELVLTPWIANSTGTIQGGVVASILAQAAQASAGLGSYAGKEIVHAGGKYVVPGLIDAHMHLETVKLLVNEFARLVLPLGTTAVVADPHEVANVLGTDGIHWLADLADEVPLDIFFMASSSVPASRFESPRRALTLGDLQGLLRRRRVIGLAEMMNYPGVVSGDPHELDKLGLESSHVDGHAPGLLGRVALVVGADPGGGVRLEGGAEHAVCSGSRR